MADRPTAINDPASFDKDRQQMPVPKVSTASHLKRRRGMRVIFLRSFSTFASVASFLSGLVLLVVCFLVIAVTGRIVAAHGEC